MSLWKISKAIPYLFFFFLLFLDIWSKYFVNNFLSHKISILWDFLSLQFFKNTWIAFSFPLSWMALKVITFTLIFGIIYYYLKEEKKKKNFLVDYAFVLILAWAIWNGIERIFLWQVTDFISVAYFSIFNLADAFITIWGFLFVYTLIQKK